MGVSGDFATLAQIKQRVQQAPIVIAQNVARQGAPEITSLAKRAYESGQTVYGDARPTGKGGRPLTLRRTGATAQTVQFVAIGTIMRCVLGTDYARYLIGKYGILPSGPKAALPYAWGKKLLDITAEQRV